MKTCYTSRSCANRGPHHVSSSLMSRRYLRSRDYFFSVDSVPVVPLPLVSEKPFFARLLFMIKRFVFYVLSSLKFFFGYGSA